MFRIFARGLKSPAACLPIVTTRALLLGNTNILPGHADIFPEMLLHIVQCSQAIIAGHTLSENVASLRAPLKCQ